MKYIKRFMSDRLIEISKITAKCECRERCRLTKSALTFIVYSKMKLDCHTFISSNCCILQVSFLGIMLLEHSINISPHLAPKLKMGRDIPLPPLCLHWHAVG